MSNNRLTNFISKAFLIPLFILGLSLSFPQIALSQLYADPGGVCGGSDHKKCRTPVDDIEYICKGTDGHEINVDSSDEMGSCEKK